MFEHTPAGPMYTVADAYTRAANARLRAAQSLDRARRIPELALYLDWAAYAWGHCATAWDHIATPVPVGRADVGAGSDHVPALTGWDHATEPIARGRTFVLEAWDHATAPESWARASESETGGGADALGVTVEVMARWERAACAWADAAAAWVTALGAVRALDAVRNRDESDAAPMWGAAIDDTLADTADRCPFVARIVRARTEAEVMVRAAERAEEVAATHRARSAD